MSLQRRLTLFFVLIVILPLAAAGFVVQRVIVGEITRRAVISLQPSVDATVSLYNSQSQSLDRRVRLALLRGGRLGEVLTSEDPAAIDAFLQQRLLDVSELDFLIALTPSNEILVWESNSPHFMPGVEAPNASEIVKQGPGAGSGFSRTPVISVRSPRGDDIGGVIGGFWLDNDLLLASSNSQTTLAIVSDGRILASSDPSLDEPAGVSIDFGGPFELSIDDAEAKAIATKLDTSGDVAVVAFTPSAPLNALSQRVLSSMLLLLLLALVGTSVLAYLLARLITQPLEELAQGAEAIADGRFDHRIGVRSKDEVGQLAQSFNEMTEKLQSTVTQLSSSRDQMRRAVQRVGETLRSTHDMKQMLESILNTAADAVDADVAVLWVLTATRDQLRPAFSRGVTAESLSLVNVGEGMVGFVAERATPVLLAPNVPGPRLGREEPTFPVALAVPLYSQDRMLGVVAAYRHHQDRPFSSEDLETVSFLTEQGGVAIENVRLHEEAQRLSLTDGLTGIYNRRFFQMQFKQVLATAQRFERPFSILMMDLDYFKRVNDTYGHQRGDAILVEFSQRVTQLLREVDTFARYGGEEFIALLSETDLAGASTTAEKIRDAIRGEPFGGMDEELLKLTVSTGIACHPDHGASYQTLVELADKALYRAKQEGRDRICVAGEDAGPNLKLAR